MQQVLRYVFLSLLPLVTQAQSFKQGSIWYLGGHAGLDFKYDPPKILDDGKIEYLDGRTSTVTDESGNLLFYTNGDTVWNKYHEVMQNGIGINTYKAGLPVTSVIVPHPGDGQLYYIFTTNLGQQADAIPTAFIYAVVDVSGNSGRGSVLQKNVKLFDWSTVLLSVTSHADGKSFWVITHGYGNNAFYAYKVSESGIASPVVTNVGSIYNYWTQQLKASPDATKIAVANYGSADLYDFNAMTGIVSNARALGNTGAAGVEFSPNSELLYVSTYVGSIFQYDVSEVDPDKIRLSQLEIGHRWFYETEFTDLQLAYNGKIYAGAGAGAGTDSLLTINSPNVKGIGCNYTNEGMPFWLAWISFLPTAIQSYYRDSPAIVTSAGCKNTLVQSRITSLGYADSIVWNFGDGNRESHLGASGKIVDHIYSEVGDYSITAKKYIGDVYREISALVKIVNKPFVNLGKDTVLCRGETLLIDAGNNGSQINWSTGETGQQITISESGQYIVRIDNGVCATVDTINISIKDFPPKSLGEDRIICNSDSVTLSVIQNSYYAIKWSTGEQTASIVTSESGIYSAMVSEGRCTTVETIDVRMAQVKNLQLKDTVLTAAYGSEVLFEATALNADIWEWFFGDGVDEITNSPMNRHLYTRAGNHKGHLVASNKYGCTAEVNFRVNFPYYLFIPNVFTPNGDGRNDTFDVRYNGEGPITLNVYNRWGEEIFTSHSLSDLWRGEGSQGTYYYRFIVGGKTFTGWVRVLD
jgi:gliding motility-associated-like protein